MPTRIGIVTWQDSWYTDSFQKSEELEHEPEDFTIVSIGHLIRETPIQVTLGMDFEGTGSGSYREIKRIRRENIRDIRIVEI